MALRWLLPLEFALYACCFVCGIITAASLTILQGDFEGRCMLYGSVILNISDIRVSSSSSPSLCYFVSAISVCVAIFCFSTTLYGIYSYWFDGEFKRERVWMSISLAVCTIFLFFIMVTGCILKVGRDRLCDSLLQNVPNITRCDQAQGKSWTSPLIGSSFFSKLHRAEMAVWVNFFGWMIIAVLVMVQRRWGSDTSRQEDPGASPSETEPFLKHPEQPH